MPVRRGSKPPCGSRVPGGSPACSWWGEEHRDFASPPRDGFALSPWTSGLGGLSVFAGVQLDRTCVHESVGKIQVVQIRRVLLLFGLVLGLSALVASIAPQPSEDDQAPESTVAAPAVEPPADLSTPIRLSAREDARIPTRRVQLGSSFSLAVRVPEAGDVVIDDLGVRQTADPRAPARFDLLAYPAGTHAVGFVPLRGERRPIGQLEFVEEATVTPRRRDR